MKRVRIKGRNADGVIPTTARLDLLYRQPITFIENECPRNPVQIQVLEDPDDGGNLDVDIGGAGVDHMHEEVRFAQFLQRRTERPDEFLGKIPDKTDGVRNDDLPILWEPEPAAGRIEGFKQPVL